MYILTGSEMHACDVNTSEAFGVPSLVLMERAALALAEEAKKHLRREDLCLAVSGSGNNGADAIACARILSEEGYRAAILLVSDRLPAAGSSLEKQLEIAKAYELPVYFLSEKGFPEDLRPALILDGIFGTGLAREVTGKSALAVREINRLQKESGAYVLAADIPSGISADDGRALGPYVRADSTVTFAFSKCGHYLEEGRGAAGNLVIAPIGITPGSFTQEPSMVSYDAKDIRALLPVRDPSGNKGTFGKLLFLAGTFKMCGAALLCAGAALRSGAGMVRVLTHEKNRVIVQTGLPESLLETWSEEESDDILKKKLKACLAWADTLAAGPGLGRSEGSRRILALFLEACLEEASKGLVKGLVLDADALFFLAGDPEIRKMEEDLARRWPLVLTPHLGEFSALTGASLAEIRSRRTGLVREAADRFGAVICCKDARTLTAAPGKKTVHLNRFGNAGMASAGSGDVLTGILAALLAVCKDPYEAGSLAVTIHALAGDLARDRLGERGMTAGDISAALPEVFRKLEENDNGSIHGSIL